MTKYAAPPIRAIMAGCFGMASGKTRPHANNSRVSIIGVEKISAARTAGASITPAATGR